MPIEATPVATAPAAAMHPLAARRILRLAFGTALSLLVSQVFAWQLAFIAPVLTMFFLALPMPSFDLRKWLGIVLALAVPMVVASVVLLPFLMHARAAGIVLVAVAFWLTFWFTARGGSPVLGNLMTVGLALVVTVGSVNPDILMQLIQAMIGNAAIGLAFVVLAHRMLPDLASEVPAHAPTPPVPEAAAMAVRDATRSLLAVLPLVLVFLFSSGSAAFVPVMIKVASMGQQVSADKSRAMGLSLLSSTVWGSIGAIAVWWLLGAWPSLIPYTLAVAITGLLFGRRIFHGAAVHPDHDKWSYAFLTMLVLLGPAVTDSPTSDGVGFVQRLLLFLLVAVYGTIAVAVFDAFLPRRAASAQ